MLPEQISFCLDQRDIQRLIGGGPPEIAVPLDDFIPEDLVVAKRRRDQFGEASMILVRIKSIGREKQIRAGLSTQFLDGGLGLVPVGWQPPILKLQHSDPEVGTRAEGSQGGMLFVLAFRSAAGKHEHVNPQAGVGRAHE
jgi:hypothetical protein